MLAIIIILVFGTFIFCSVYSVISLVRLIKAAGRKNKKECFEFALMTVIHAPIAVLIGWFLTALYTMKIY